jgi:hypothetical protein
MKVKKNEKFLYNKILHENIRNVIKFHFICSIIKDRIELIYPWNPKAYKQPLGFQVYWLLRANYSWGGSNFKKPLKWNDQKGRNSKKIKNLIW